MDRIINKAPPRISTESEWGTHFFVRYFSHLVKKEEEARTRPPHVCLRTCGHAVAIAGGGVECSGKITHADPRPVKTPANATLKFDVELLAFGPKAKEM
ncbi:hypothetical protein PR001_g12927 [Phytophthora rubi]|uniref:Uncharacterized protein n=1 Tax=Phytophthora rubi TaxID=129364 RepID=A0A6A3M036_9STRA|nr:hypothetical protein PR001_g12927 [Phytophthora rubi]